METAGHRAQPIPGSQFVRLPWIVAGKHGIANSARIDDSLQHLGEADVKSRNNFCAITLALCACLPAYGQWKELPATGSPSNRLPDRTTLTGQSGQGPLLMVKLVEPEHNAQNHKAVVEVQTDGLKIVDPAAADNEPKLDEGHIQYRLDNGAIQNTTSKTWTFGHLSRGEHLIRVALASNDGHQLGSEKALKVKVP